MVRIASILIFLASFAGADALALTVKVSEKTRYYSVSGARIQTVVKAMSRKGPWFDELNVRAIALADYSYKTHVKTTRSGGTCRVQSASVTMSIIYILPKLSRSARLSRKEQANWKRIRNIISSHEKRHGTNYRQLAHNIQRALIKMKPQKNCSAFRKIERDLRKRLELADKRKNQLYDRASYKGIYRKLDQLAPYWRKR